MTDAEEPLKREWTMLLVGLRLALAAGSQAMVDDIFGRMRALVARLEQGEAFDPEDMLHL